MVMVGGGEWLVWQMCVVIFWSGIGSATRGCWWFIVVMVVVGGGVDNGW